MSIAIIKTEDKEILYNDVSNWAFGPLFEKDEAEDFLEWYSGDIRRLPDEEFEQQLHKFRTKNN